MNKTSYGVHKKVLKSGTEIKHTGWAKLEDREFTRVTNSL